MSFSVSVNSVLLGTFATRAEADAAMRGALAMSRAMSAPAREFVPLPKAGVPMRAQREAEARRSAIEPDQRERSQPALRRSQPTIAEAMAQLTDGL